MNMKKKSRKMELDVIRIVACLMVFMLHTLICTKQLVDFSKEGMKVWWTYTPAWGGVWIFFFLSAWFSAGVFWKEDYKYTLSNVLRFYGTKIIKIGIPSYFFTFLLIITHYTTYWTNTDIMIRLFTFRFNGIGGVDGIGALWYISTLMQLFLLTPFLMMAIHKLFRRVKSRIVWKCLIGIIVLLGLGNRLLLLKYNITWYEWIYTFSLSNLDIYICGLLCHVLCSQKKKESAGWLKWMASAGMIAVIGSNTWIYYAGDYGNADCMMLYQYVYPSFYILALTFFTSVFHSNAPDRLEEGTERRGKRMIRTVITRLSGYTFWFYLWHSFVLPQIYQQIRVSGPVSTHLRLMGYTAVITLVLSIFFENAFSLLLRPMISRLKTPGGGMAGRKILANRRNMHFAIDKLYRVRYGMRVSFP